MNSDNKENINNKKYKYFAFISYNSQDTGWGKRLQRKLEHYSMPSTICSERGWKRRPINPVWFAPTDIQPGALDEELKKRLEDSRNLIVICSPASAISEWVGKEIRYFHELGRDKNIHFFIVDGIPNSGDTATECFNPVVKKLGIPEILGANIHEKIYRCPRLNRERAYVQLISKLLGVEYDAIWKRHRRLLIEKAISWALGIIAVVITMTLIWINNQPFDSTIRLTEQIGKNSNLPPLRDAVISVSLGDETRTDTITDESDHAVFRNLPHKYLDKKVRLSFSCQDYIPVDTVITLDKTNTLAIRRDPAVYGNITASVYDFHSNTPVANTRVIIDGFETQSDSEGNVSLFVPLESQKSRYEVRMPEYNLTDTITMPTNEYYTIAI